MAGWAPWDIQRPFLELVNSSTFHGRNAAVYPCQKVLKADEGSFCQILLQRKRYVQ